MLKPDGGLIVSSVEDGEHQMNSETLPIQAIAALKAGSKIEAIKIVREQQGVGLKEAKEIVETYIEATPVIRQQLSAASARGARSLLQWIVLLGGVAAIAWYVIIDV